MTLANWTRANKKGALLPLVVLVIAVCSSPPEPEPSTKVEPTLMETVASDKGLDGEPDSEQRESELVGPEPMITSAPEEVAAEMEHSQVLYDLHFGAAVASLEERIYLADVIVRATLLSAANDVLTFNAAEYLKGSGPSRFTVSASTARRNTQWDGNEAILFLSRGDGASDEGRVSTTFEFTDTTEFNYFPDDSNAWSPTFYRGRLGGGYTIDTENPVWTPAKAQTGGGTGQSGVDEYIAETQSPLGEVSPTFTLGELKEKIAWITGGEGVEGYDECIRWSLKEIRYLRDWEAYHGEGLDKSEYTLELGSGVVGVDILKTTHIDSRVPYNKYRLEGEDAHLFSYHVVDDDTDPANGYSRAITAIRPLPSGEYTIVPNTQTDVNQPCDNWGPPGFLTVTYKVNVTAPEGTVLEALFDPVDLSSGIGFSPAAGMLTSPEFSVEGRTTTIIGLSWQAGSVVLSLDPFSSLGGYDLEFIELDGSVSLTLEASSAAENSEASTLTWTVSDQPWEMGDHLMLRIRSHPDARFPIPSPGAEILSAGANHSCSLWPGGEVVCWGDDEYGQSSPPEGERFVTISAGRGHTCGLRGNGEAVCWGNDTYGDGESSPPEGEKFVAISAGSRHSCGLREDGEAVCWGWDDSGQASPPENEGFVVVSAGAFHTCGLRADGSAVCWGGDNHGESSPPEGQRFVAIGAGDSHTCGLRADGETWCWGLLRTGRGDRPRPSGERFVAISAGGNHTCGLRADGTAVCWGDDQYGQSSPPGDERFVAIAGGDNHTCGKRADGEAVCWGSDSYGESTPPRDWKFTAISAGYFVACGLGIDGAVVCWGSGWGQLDFPKGETFLSITAGSYQACGLKTDGVTVCWGEHESGRASPPQDERFEALTAGWGHTCGLREDGMPVCWGSDYDGQSKPPENERFVSISAGSRHTCGLRADGVAVCWGNDQYGQSSPPENGRFVAMSVGGYHTCGLRGDGVPVCWGIDLDGRSSPPQDERFEAISAGAYHTCALRKDGETACWGSNNSGALIPPPGERLVDISAGENYTCGLRSDGEAVCWGDNEGGRATPPSGEHIVSSPGDRQPPE